MDIAVLILTQLCILAQMWLNFKNSIKERKMDNIAIAIEMILEIFRDYQNKTQEEFTEILNDLRVQLFKFGSNKAIKIFSKICTNTFESKRNNEKNSGIRNLVLYPLLLTQIRYDTTGDILNPEYWFLITISDYTESYKTKSFYAKMVNDYIDELGLDKRLEYER